ncbi:DUF1688-domain-containing protein [Glonium stellatum]|uniref:DUF1688-domain-containing protein n=1 Tax=Glonium stellatum TaxID=574774 RepID=A0A8E2EVC1_9PEZI|nr:DUF1688-domain-containing protein [Glonium stellatum]
MDPQIRYLLSLRAIRERAKVVWDVAEAGDLTHFDLHKDRLDDVAAFVTSIIKRDFGPDKFDTIPPHGRWQHFEAGDAPRIQRMMEEWKKSGCDDSELARRLIDLFFVSVLLDAGAGNHWRYIEPQTGQKYERSEGIAVASLYMFKSLSFTASKSTEIPLVDGKGLENLTTEDLMAGFQVSEKNPILGVESRAALLRSLGKSLLSQSDVFGASGRPGNLVDYMMKTANNSLKLDVNILWDVLQDLLIPVWPKDRTMIAGFPIGDAWPLSTLQSRVELPRAGDNTGSIQPFHKLTQWLTYSLMVPFQRVLGVQWISTESLTGLPEYRNGGLFVDMGALSLKKDALHRGLKASGQELPLFDAGDDVIVEWRAMTVILLDVLYDMILSRMGQGVRLSMAQVLESGTWKAGREIAAQHRPDTKSSPILIRSDGTVF